MCKVKAYFGGKVQAVCGKCPGCDWKTGGSRPVCFCDECGEGGIYYWLSAAGSSPASLAVDKNFFCMYYLLLRSSVCHYDF